LVAIKAWRSGGRRQAGLETRQASGPAIAMLIAVGGRGEQHVPQNDFGAIRM
jgi:hypothetical protein